MLSRMQRLLNKTWHGPSSEARSFAGLREYIKESSLLEDRGNKLVGSVDGSNGNILNAFTRTGHLVPEPPGITFIQVIDEAASQGDLNVGILTGHAHKAFRGELAFKGLGSGQLPPHQPHDMPQ